MSTAAQTIHLHLESVARARAQRVASPPLAARVMGLKAFQQRRFAHSYGDLLASARYGASARFFLDELYGPTDFAQRDAQFARLVPALVRLFPPEIVDTVAAVARLHDLSERLDSETAAVLGDGPVQAGSFLQAWAARGGREDRQAQIDMTVDIAARLDRLTRKTLLRASLRMMRVPAHAAGLGKLQDFLETGFDAFRAMHGSSEFIAVIRTREAALADALFRADPGDLTAPASVAALGLLP